MNKLQSRYFNDPMLQLTISELSVKASVQLTEALRNIETFRLVVNQMRMHGPNPGMIELAQRQINAVEQTQKWLLKEREYMLDFVLDLQEIVAKLFASIRKEFKAFVL